VSNQREAFSRAGRNLYGNNMLELLNNAEVVCPLLPCPEQNSEKRRV